MNISESNMFPQKDALPKEWDFIIEPNEVIEIITSIQIKVKYEGEVKRLILYPSTLSGEYSLVQLKRLIVSTFNIKKNSSLKISCVQTNSVLQTDLHFLQAIQDCFFLDALYIQVSLIKVEDPCILCVSYDCYHSTTRSLSKKRKGDEHDTLIPEFLEPVSNEGEKNINSSAKKRKLTLSGSIPKSPFKVSHAINSSFPKQILINF